MGRGILRRTAPRRQDRPRRESGSPHGRRDSTRGASTARPRDDQPIALRGRRRARCRRPAHHRAKRRRYARDGGPGRPLGRAGAPAPRPRPFAAGTALSKTSQPDAQVLQSAGKVPAGAGRDGTQP